MQTYLVRAVTAIRDLATFRRFLALLASRTGGMLNRTDLAAPLGVSVPTISEWLKVLGRGLLRNLEAIRRMCAPV